MAKDAHGRFHWNELLTNDVGAAKAFYSKMMGWVFDEMKMPDGGDYLVAIKGDDPVAGIAGMPSYLPADTAPHWISYVEVEEIDAQVAKAKAAGATVLMEPFDVPETGRIAILKDPTGAMIGWITPDFND